MVETRQALFVPGLIPEGASPSVLWEVMEGFHQRSSSCDDLPCQDMSSWLSGQELLAVRPRVGGRRRVCVHPLVRGVR